MRVLLVTSQVTYIPNNYRGILDALFEKSAQHIAGLVLLTTLNSTWLKKLAGLYAYGCYRIANTATRNILALPKNERAGLFEKRGLPVLRAESMNDTATIEWVKSQDIDMIVNVRTRCIYKNTILNLPRFGCLNVHHGLLPKYRGTMCDLYALSENRPAGFSIHQMVKKIDDGRIFHVEEVSSGEDNDYIEYLGRTAYREGLALAGIINEIAEKDALPEGQENACDDVVFTKTPEYAGIKKLQKLGMIL